MAKSVKLSAEQIEEIMKHKPDPNKKSARQLAEEHGCSTSYIQNLWRADRENLSKYQRKDYIPPELLEKIANLKGEKEAVEVAEEFMILARIIKKFWSTLG